MQAPAWSTGWRRLLPLLVAGAVSVAVAGFPIARPALAIGLLLAAALVAWRPWLLLVLVPALLPVLDLAPWSGRRVIDEFDLLLALLLAVAWARLPRAATAPAPVAESLAFALLMAALALGMVRALMPWPNADLADPGNPLSPLNALRLAKGAFWAWGLWRMVRRLQAAGAPVGGAFAWGMVLGLLGTVVCILIERLAFSSLLDFSSDYRISGPFSVMSLGGAYVECYLAVSLPFLLTRMLPPLVPWRLAAGGVLLAGTAYSLMVTFSRGGYAAMVCALAVSALAILASRQQRLQRLAMVISLTGLAAAVSYPVLMGAFAQARLKTVSVDLQTREQHWTESLHLVGNGIRQQLFGIGLGRFAQANFWASPQGERAGGHHLLTDAAQGQALRLGAGYGYFVEQIVDVVPEARYRLSYRVRTDSAKDSLAVMLCQKWIIASFKCGTIQPPTGGAPRTAGTWQSVSMDILAPPRGPGRLPRPVRLALNNQSRVPVTVSQVSLLSPNGEELIANGGFAAGMDHWTFTSDHHLAWHTKSMLLGVYVELGLLGAASFMALLMAGAWRALMASRRSQADGVALLAALSAYTVVGLFDTLVDAPRFLMLWLLLCLMPSALPPADQRSVSG